MAHHDIIVPAAAFLVALLQLTQILISWVLCCEARKTKLETRKARDAAEGAQSGTVDLKNDLHFLRT